jgi:putative flippase GtrA
MVFLVELAGFTSVKLQNIAYAVSIETSIICGFALHSIFTWRYRFRSALDFAGKLFKFNAITGISFAVRQALFYVLLLAGVSYIPNTFIGIVVAIMLNFVGYEKLVFKHK